MTDVTVAITAHAEGDLLGPTLESFIQAARELELVGLSVEKIVSIDRPDHKTKKFLSHPDRQSTYKLIELDYGDQGKVRNHLAQEAKGKYLAFLDGDDLWGFNWLLEAYQCCIHRDRRCVVYPEFNWYFEGSNNIFVQSDFTSDHFDFEALRITNLWDALCFSEASLFRDFPYISRKIKEGFAFEDWNCNRRIFEAGISQVVAKNTVIFKRRRQGSQGDAASQRGVIAEPTKSCFYDFYEK